MNTIARFQQYEPTAKGYEIFDGWITGYAEGYVAKLDALNNSVSISQHHGNWAGNGTWNGRIEDCAAQLGETQERSEEIYEALDEVLLDGWTDYQERKARKSVGALQGAPKAARTRAITKAASEARAKLRKAARGSYQRDLARDNASWSGSGLRGKARDYSVHYADSRNHLLNRADIETMVVKQRDGVSRRRPIIQVAVLLKGEMIEWLVVDVFTEEVYEVHPRA